MKKKKVVAKRISPLNTSGTTGVRFQTKSQEKNGTLYIYDVVACYWRDERNKQMQTCFSINKHGKQGAWKLAVAKRKAMVRKYY